MNIEGACFVTRSACAPFYGLVVLNKNGPDDFRLDIKVVMNIKLQSPYLMLRYATAGAPCIVGLWFHDEAERDEIKEILTRTMAMAAGVSTVPIPTVVDSGLVSTSSSKGGNDGSSAASKVDALKRLLASPASGSKMPIPTLVDSVSATAATAGASLSKVGNDVSNAASKVDALKKLLASPAAKTHSSTPLPQTTVAVSTATAPSAGSLLLSKLRGGILTIPESSAPPPVENPSNGGKGQLQTQTTDHIFLTDREIAAKKNGAAIQGIQGTQVNDTNMGGKINSSEGLNDLASKLKKILKGQPAPMEQVATEPHHQPPVPGAQRIPVASLFSKASASTKVNEDQVKPAAPVTSTPPPAPALAAAKLLSPSDLLGALRKGT